MGRRKIFRLQAEDLQLSHQVFNNWYFSDRAETVVADQYKHLAALGPRCFGYQAVQIGSNPGQPLLDDVMTQHHAVFTPSYQQNLTDGICDLVHLPFESNSLDVLYLNHVLDYAPNPHWCLQEAHRVVADHGSLIISGFNPLSLFGMYAYASRFKRYTAWRKHSISLHRLEDWFGILGFELHTLQRSPVLPAHLQLPGLLDSWSQKHGSLYTLRACKEIARLTPVRPRWGSKVTDLVSLKPALLAKKATNQHKDY